MSTEPVLSVRGEATIEVEPEIAVVWVTVLARDKDRRRAIDLLAERSKRVTSMIKGFGDAVEKLESGRVNVQPEFKDGRARERVTAYVAQAGISVTVGDFVVLGEIVTGLAGQEMVAVTGPDWQLRPDSPVRGAARLAAAKDAITRAREYAAAFGGTITGLAEAADTGLLAAAQPQRTFMAARVMGGPAPGEEGAAEFDFEPAQQTVSAQVEARFTMTAPSFGE
jgi:uncharacterized protein YggE